MNEKIKIMFFLPNLNGAGAERVTVNILRLLDSEKFDISLVLVKKTGEYIDSIPENIKIYDLGLKKSVYSIFKLRKIVMALQPHIIFSTLFRTHNVIYLALFGMKKKPIVVLRSPNSPKLLLEHNQMSFIQKYLLESAYKSADVVLAQTPEMRDEIIKYHVVDKKKVQVFLNPIDIDLIDEKIKNLENPFDSSSINVVAAGRIIYQKGFDVLIRSFQRVVKQNPFFKLYIIGQDVVEEQKELQELVEKLDLTQNIFFLGHQKNPYQYFYFADLYVLSSRWEGLPNTVLENLYLKKPIVSTRCIPFMDSLIKEGENGFLVDVEDVKGLSRAILKYKELTLNFSDLINTKSNVDSLFLDIKEKE